MILNKDQVSILEISLLKDGEARMSDRIFVRQSEGEEEKLRRGQDKTQLVARGNEEAEGMGERKSKSWESIQQPQLWA